MKARAQIRTASLQGYREFAASLGLDPIAMMRAAGIDPRRLNDPDGRVPADAVYHLFEQSALAAGVPDFGLRMAAARSFAILGPVSLLARDAPTIADALHVIVRHMHVHNESLHIELVEDGRLTSICFVTEVDTPLGMRQCYEMCSAVFMNILKPLFGPEWKPARVQFEHPAPPDLRPHRRTFGCPVHFGQPVNAIAVPTAQLQQPNPIANPDFARYAQKFLQGLGEAAEAGTAERVRQLIRLEIATGRCSVERVAQSLGVDKRTVHRKLAEEGTTYTELVAAVREDLAHRHLPTGTRTLGQVAQLLGFSELSAFSRWHRSRFGISPSVARSRGQRAR
jgi:AraC-like DNA-binding protein